MNIHIFAGTKETYHKPTVNVAAASYNVGDDAYHFSYAHLDKSIIELLSSTLTACIADILALDSTVLDKTISVICNSTTGWDSSVFERLTNAQDHSKACSAISGNAKMPNRDEWLAIATSLTKLSDLGIKINSKYKETPETIKEALICDSAAAQATHHTLVNPDNGLEVASLIAKDRKKRAKALPSLLVDKYLFNWSPTHETAIYYTCNTELENKKAKSKKANPLLDRGFVYYSGDNKRLRVAGRLSAQDRYNVVILKDKCAFLENVLAHQVSVLKNIYSTRPAVMFRIGSLTGGGGGNFIEENDFKNVGYDIHGDLYTLTAPRADLSYVFNPPRLAFKIKRIMETNTERTLALIASSETKVLDMHRTDVTDSFFVWDDKGKCKLRPTITTSTKDLRLKDVLAPDGRNINPKVLVKYDIPTRNELNRISKDNPKIEIITWEFDPHIVSYAFLITTDAGWLFYSSEHGSKHLLPTARKSQRK